MIGLLFIFSLVCYVLIARFVAKLVFKKTERVLYKRLAIAFFILLPTWDIIIGYPLYWYLCKSEAGIEIHETIDDVQGYYVGVNLNKWSLLLPIDGFQYVDYTLKYSDKFFRNSWLDNNTDEACYQPTGQLASQSYKEAFNSGKCITISEITKAHLSRYEVNTSSELRTQIVPFLKIEKIISPVITDRLRKKELSRFVFFRWDRGWVANSLTIGGTSWTYSKNVDLFKIQNSFVADASILMSKTFNQKR